MHLSDSHPTVGEHTPRRPRAQQGSAMVEFALVLPLLLILTLCVIDLSRAFFAKNVAVQAAREGARVAVLLTTALAPDSARACAQRVVAGARMSMSSCTFQDLGNRQWQVTVSVQYNWLNPGLFSLLNTNFTNPLTLTAAAVMRKEGF